jgi:hypothetical protein
MTIPFRTFFTTGLGLGDTTRAQRREKRITEDYVKLC